MHWLAFLLYPFSFLWGGITHLRNWLYDLGVLATHRSQVPSILVGNLRVGGTGKTPMVEYLIRNLKNERNLATLSRGYGRKTRGFLKAVPTSTPQQIGDEPFQIYQKFGNEIDVFVGEDRVEASQSIAGLPKSPGLLLLDDAFQHRSFQAHCSILLSTWDDPFFEDYLMPMGRLRESRSGAKRADVVVITKCPDTLSDLEKSTIQKKVQFYAGEDKPVLFSRISYANPQSLVGEEKFKKKVVLFSGIAQSKAFENYCKKEFQVLDFIEFPDHYDYSSKDLNRLNEVLSNHSAEEFVILTTEKDGVKVKNLLPNGFLGEIPIFVLPIQVILSPQDQELLLELIQQKVFD